jgi:hypothetical protein
MQMTREKAEIEFANEVRKAEAMLQIERIRAENTMAIERMKAEHDARIKQQAAETDIAITERKATIDNAKRVESMKQDRDVLAEPVREIIEPIQQVQSQMAQFLSDMSRQNAEAQQHLFALIGEVRSLVSAEKELVRGADGRVTGARIKQAVMN